MRDHTVKEVAYNDYTVKTSTMPQCYQIRKNVVIYECAGSVKEYKYDPK